MVIIQLMISDTKIELFPEECYLMVVVELMISEQIYANPPLEGPLTF